MKAESLAPSIDLKTAAFKALLQGPLIFFQFSCRFCISENDMQGWLDDAGANLALARQKLAHVDEKQKRCSSPLLGEERKILFGDSRQ